MLSQDISILGQLDAITAQLRAREQNDLADQLRQVTDVLRAAVRPVQEDVLITTTEAAQVLGVRSVNTIKRWVREGLLEGYRRGGRVLVSRSSVEQMAQDSVVGRQRAYEQGLAAALAPFDIGDDVPAEELETMTQRGRAPWATDAGVRS